MELLKEVKLMALEIVNLIDNSAPNNAGFYGKIGENIEKLYALRLDIIKYPYKSRTKKEIL